MIRENSLCRLYRLDRLGVLEAHQVLQYAIL